MREIEITGKEQGQRADKFLLKYMNKANKSFVYKMIRKKNIKLNDKRLMGNELLKTGDVIKLYLADETIDKFREDKRILKTERNFSIVFEDENILLCGKPAGLIVHPDKEHKTNTLNDQLLYYLYKKGEYNPNNSMGFVPSVCNRLDVNTSGIVAMGKNLNAVQELNRGFRDRLIDKYYITLVKGVVEKSGTIEGYHSKSSENTASISKTDNGGSYICTHYRPIKSNGKYTLLEIKLETGKSHQIRVCMKYIGHPIVGDRKYGDYEVNKYYYDKFGLENQFLHSYRLVMKLKTGPLNYLYDKEFKCDMDSSMENICKILL